MTASFFNRFLRPKRTEQIRASEQAVSATGPTPIGTIHPPLPPSDQRKKQIISHQIFMHKIESVANYLIIVVICSFGAWLAVFQADEKIKTLGGGFVGSGLGAVIQKLHASSRDACLRT